MRRFLEKYNILKEEIFGISEALQGYLDEVDEKSGMLEEFCADYTLKISATVYNQYHEEKVAGLIKEMVGLAEKSEKLSGFEEYLGSVEASVKDLEKLYMQGGCEEDEMSDLKYSLELPFEDMECLFDDEGWEYDKESNIV